MNTIDQMASDLPHEEAEQVRHALTEIAMLAQTPAPPMSAELMRLVHGGLNRRSRRRRAAVAAAAGVFALGGTSVAAAQNTLPAPAQQAIAEFADDHLPVSVPHPEAAPTLAPVQQTTPQADEADEARLRAQKAKEPKPANTTAPGQIQKLTKPDPRLPGPARPADPGSHGRDNNADNAKADKAKKDKADKSVATGKAAKTG